MDVVMTAGGRPQPGDSLYALTQGGFKALLELNGKPLIQWVLDALNGTEKVGSIVIVGLPPTPGLNSVQTTDFPGRQRGFIEQHSGWRVGAATPEPGDCPIPGGRF